MSRRRVFIVIIIAICALANQPVSGQFSAIKGNRQNYIAIGQGSQTEGKTVNGTQILFAIVPDDLDTETVIFYVDDKEIGRSTTPPYTISWESKSVSNGEHTVLWNALDNADVVMTRGSIAIDVSNDSNDETSEIPTEVITQPEFTLYSNTDLDISFQYPSSWTVKNESESVPKDWQKGYWLAISTDPISDATYVINLKHRLLQIEHTAESYAKYTPYVASWKKETINGHPAFTTTAGTPEAARVVHRIMMLDGRHLYMLNCIDTSGKPAELSRVILMNIAESIDAPIGDGVI